MTTYGSIPQTEGAQVNGDSLAPRSSALKNAAIALAILLSGAGAFVILQKNREPQQSTFVILQQKREPQQSISTSHWPSVVYSGSVSSANKYKGTLGSAEELKYKPAGRPTTTSEAVASGWAKIDKNCVAHLGYPWAFNGTVTKGAPVTLYFSKDFVDGEDGRLTGIAVHYFDGVAPAKMIERSIFSKGTEYDTIQVAFRDKDTELCGEASLSHNNNEDVIIDVILADGKGRKALPTKEDVAEASGEWAQGSCVKDMGTHWEHDIVGGSNLTFEAENLFPIVPMYDAKNGTLNAIFFQAPAPMQNWDIDYCGLPFPPFTPELQECLTKTNMWDGGPGLRQETVTPLYMCSNFCSDNCDLTGAAGSPATFTTMHWWFVDSVSDCTTGKGPECEPI